MHLEDCFASNLSGVDYPLIITEGSNEVPAVQMVTIMVSNAFSISTSLLMLYLFSFRSYNVLSCPKYLMNTSLICSPYKLICNWFLTDLSLQGIVPSNRLKTVFLCVKFLHVLVNALWDDTNKMRGGQSASRQM